MEHGEIIISGIKPQSSEKTLLHCH